MTVSGVNDIHSYRLLHRNLSSNNIMITLDKEKKFFSYFLLSLSFSLRDFPLIHFIDFGYTNCICKSTDKIFGTPEYFV
jgi:serine/threonine protein kinase